MRAVRADPESAATSLMNASQSETGAVRACVARVQDLESGLSASPPPSASLPAGPASPASKRASPGGPPLDCGVSPFEVHAATAKTATPNIDEAHRYFTRV